MEIMLQRISLIFWHFNSNKVRKYFYSSTLKGYGTQRCQLPTNFLYTRWHLGLQIDFNETCYVSTTNEAPSHPGLILHIQRL